MKSWYTNTQRFKCFTVHCLRSSCMYKTSLSFMVNRTFPSFPSLPCDDTGANGAVWSYSSGLGRSDPPLSLSLVPPILSAENRQEEKCTGLKGCTFSQKPCCHQYVRELNMYRALTYGALLSRGARLWCDAAVCWQDAHAEGRMSGLTEMMRPAELLILTHMGCEQRVVLFAVLCQIKSCMYTISNPK